MVGRQGTILSAALSTFPVGQFLTKKKSRLGVSPGGRGGLRLEKGQV